MKKLILPLVMITVIVFGLSTPAAQGSSGFSVTPVKLEATVDGDTISPLYIYITSQYDGNLIIGKEDIPFHIEPESVEVKSSDKNRKIELLVHGDSAIKEGAYSGKITFLAYSGENVAYGVKIDTVITQLNGQVAEQDNQNVIEMYWWAITIAVVSVLIIFTVFLIRRRTGKSSV